MHFQIFVPKSNGSMDLASVGLGDLVANAFGSDISIGPEGVGPDGDLVKNGPGKLWGWTQVGTQFYGDKAEWFPAISSVDEEGKELPVGRYWVGIHKSSPPTPAELLRIPKPKYSSPVIDEEGREWLIPVARRYPMIIGKNPNGELFTKPLEKYREYFEKSDVFWEAFIEGKKVPGDVFWDFCQFALSQNYRMTEEVATQIGLLTNEVMREIPRIALDLEELKKEWELRDEEKNLQGGEGSELLPE